MTPALIGRDHPAAVLGAAVDRTLTSHGGLVLVVGEAGIGKTSLVTAAARRAREQGALVLGGACWDQAAAPGYWPWTQVIRALRRAVPPEEWAALQATSGEELAALLSESPAPGSGSGGTEGAGADAGGGDGGGAAAGAGTNADGPGPGGGGTGEFRLHDAVTTALVTASQRVPVVVVLDDLHWADAASVRLLEFAARHTWFERLLLIGTYRDAEVEPADHPLRPTLAALAAKATTVPLAGLGPDEAGLLMRRTVGREPDPELVAEVHRRTGGNPFFVEQTARLWHGGGTVTAIAPGVRDAVRRRLSLLAPPVAELLTSAAVLGRRFHRRVLAATAGVPVPHVDRLLDQAVAARLVTALGGGRFAFAHDLVRETLYAELGDDEARAAHAAVVRALDRSPALAERMLPAESARHADLAGDLIDPMRAVALFKAAASHASFRLSMDEAAGHLRRALERVPPDRIRDRVLLAVELGGTLTHSGDSDVVRDAFGLAADLAGESGDPELLARVALAAYRHQRSDDRGGALLEEAYRRLVSDGPPPPRVHMAQELAALIAGTARADGDDEALSFGLWARHDSLLGLGTAVEREALTTELADLARRSGDRTTAGFATSFRWVALLEQGDPRYLDAYHEFLGMGEGEESTLWSMSAMVDQSIINTLRGDFATADAQLGTVLAGDGAAHEFGYMAVHLRWALETLRGRFEEAAAFQDTAHAEEHPHAALLEGIVAVESGDTAAALGHLAAAPERYPRVVEPLWLRFLAQAAAASGDPARCERARAALLPYRGLWAVALYGCDVSGPIDLWLGVVDAAQERWDSAVDHLTRAYRSADRLRARPWSVWARTALGEALAGRGDLDTARALLARTATEAEDLDMPHIAARARRALDGLGEPGGPPGAPGAPREDVFRFDGEVWTLAYAGRTIHMPDAKGLRDLRELLANPGAPIPATALLTPDGALAAAAGRLGSDPVLDEEAKARYKERLRLLDEEIDRAEAAGDDGRAARYDRERAALLDELRAAAGLAGRDRRLGDEAERARKTVTARIRDTLRKLDDRHPDLAGHLRATVSTGTTCVYTPEDPAQSWHL
ncbi:AAA family ATPase [Actinomadura sp. 21ATH]|uniref:ATP-binding protein n=1 Tax=Actinomadura sp. 21ATH TaxID=1735444 RepID=UPI0035BFC0D2